MIKEKGMNIKIIGFAFFIILLIISFWIIKPGFGGSVNQIVSFDKQASNLEPESCHHILNLGDITSENQYLPLGFWASSKKLNLYGQHIDSVQFRDFIGETGVMFSIKDIPEEKQKISIIVKDNSFGIFPGDAEKTIVKVGGNIEKLSELGSFQIKGLDGLAFFDFEIQLSDLESDELYILLDDSLNYQKFYLDGEMGKTIFEIGLCDI